MGAIFGTSPIPTILGYLAAIIIAIQEFIKDGGLPQDTAGWMQLLVAVVIGALGRSAKQTNVSNSPIPVAPAVVSAVSEAKANPAAAKDAAAGGG